MNNCRFGVSPVIYPDPLLQPVPTGGGAEKKVVTNVVLKTIMISRHIQLTTSNVRAHSPTSPTSMCSLVQE